MEEWKDVKDFEGLYQVSNYGRVKSLERVVESKNQFGTFTSHIKERVLEPVLNSYGYLEVGLSKNGKTRMKKVHIIVAQTFLPNPNNYSDVHHKDHNPRNNNVENLMWISNKEHHSMHNKERGVKTFQYTLDGFLVNVWESANEAAETLGFDASAIRHCCNSGYWRKGKWIKITQHKGYIWKYVSD